MTSAPAAPGAVGVTRLLALREVRAKLLSPWFHLVATAVCLIAWAYGGGFQETFATEAVLVSTGPLAALDLAVELHDLLRTHLDVEDAEALPLLASELTATEYAELETRMLKDLELRQALFTVPWFMASVGPEAAAAALSTAPLPMRLVYRATRRRYAKLWHEAFCSCV